MEKQIVEFIINKDLDIANHFIALDSYKQNIKSNFQQKRDLKKDRLLKLSSSKQRKEIEKDIKKLYENKNKLNSLARDVNNEWIKIEKDFINKLEKVHKKPFPYKSIKGVLSSASRFGYNTKIGWFATDMFRNKFIAIDTATHELMHFMFHKYYWQICKEKGLPENKIWDIKESFTVILNLEFDNFRFEPDKGYPPHKKLREVIEKSWNKNHDFDKTLEAAIKSI